MKSTVIFSALLLPVLTAFPADTPQGLRESRIVEVVNEVEVLTGEDLEPHPAVEGELFQAPDFLETGRRSRARLAAADGTITRVGSNTLFSFDETSRTINLRKGSLLFHSPEGKGGGEVVTASATASVIGTTIIVEATADGGFKIFVLEGEARVTFADNTTVLLGPGQMTFVQPNSPEIPTDESGKGPVLYFDLEAFTNRSVLVNGFDTPLASLPLIRRATAEQKRKIEEGVLRETGTLILLAEGDDPIELDLEALNELFGPQDEPFEDPDLDDFEDDSDSVRITNPIEITTDYFAP